MGVNLANKTVNTNNILCDGTVDVTLSLTASPDIITNPTDIVLVLDRSGSMTGEALTNMKKGADTFVDIIAEATGGASSGEIGSGKPYRCSKLCRYGHPGYVFNYFRGRH